MTIQKDNTQEEKIEVQSPTIDELYEGTVRLEVKFKEKKLTYDVDMFDEIAKVYGNRFVPDCKIHHFGYNQYFRTNKGMSNVNKYNSVADLKRGITLAAKSRGLTVEKFIFS